MDPERQDASVYELVMQLVKHTLRRDHPNSGSLYLPRKDDVKVRKRLRSMAFEILLNKSNQTYNRGNQGNSKDDPLVQILKHAFVMKVSLQRVLEAEELENLTSDLLGQETDVENVIGSVLRLLIELKNFQTDAQPILDTFHYGKANPLLPENSKSPNGVPMFQTYPVESFIVPEKFTSILGVCRMYKQDTSNNLISGVSFEDQHVSKIVLGTESISVLSYSDDTEKRCNMVAPFMAHHTYVDTEQTSELHLSSQKVMLSMSLPYQGMRSAMNRKEYSDNTWLSDDSNCNFSSEARHSKNKVDLIWDEMLCDNNNISKLRTWESFGSSEPSKQKLFFTDLPEATLHLARIRQRSVLPLLPRKVINSVPLIKEIPLKKFLADIKLLLFGIDSDSFVYNDTSGFKLEKSVNVQDMSAESLTITCREAIRWGNSFKSLSRLVTPNPQTGKLQQDGFIFKAMCVNVKEFLLYHQAVLQRTFNECEFHGLLSLFERVRPLGKLITEVARLCGYERHSECALSGGSEILTHIYRETVKVTDPNTALIFYSILKSCCEVYFRFLQNWLFEGKCDDTYGEFMIQARSQYLRKRSRKFWTEGFAVEAASVPGFLSNLSDSILRCGKTLRLLKICNPRNPVCEVSTLGQPEVRVCLSVSALRDQVTRCQEYEGRGAAALGPVVSISSVIQDEKRMEREMAELVMRAQQEASLRFTRRQEELLAKIARRKRAQLQTLKTQAEESVLFKEKEKELETLAERLLTEKVSREVQEHQAEHLVSYYEKLAGDLEKVRTRSTWRKARMSNFERRVKLLESMKRRCRTMSEDARSLEENNFDREPGRSRVPVDAEEVSTSEGKPVVLNEDENRNFTDPEGTEASDRRVSLEGDPPPGEAPSTTSEVSTVGDRNSNRPEVPEDVAPRKTQESLAPSYIYRRNNERSDLQDFLRDETMKNLCAIMSQETSTTLDASLNNILRVDELTGKTINRPKSLAIEKIDNISTAQANKLRVLLQEYGMTPNNNEFNAILGSANVEEANRTIGIDSNALDAKQSRKPSRKVEDERTEEPADTPMSCTTDNLTTLSTHTPLSQPPNSEELFSLNAGLDTSCLSTNTVRSVTEEASLESPTSDFKWPNFFGFNPGDGKLPAAASALTTADVEILDHTSLQVYLEKSVVIPLRIQSQLVNNAIMKCLLKEDNMMLHLHSLRSYFFLLNGEFAKSLTDSLYSRLYAISVPAELFNDATLTNLLEQALMNSFNSNYVNSELLSLSVVDKPRQLCISNPDVLECLCLNYKISWPLNIILDDIVMLQYGKVFKFLIMTGRILWVLKEDFNIMKMDRNAVVSRQYHKLQLYRHSMTQFMNAVHNYITCNVLHTSWSEFEKELQNSLTIDQIYLSHMSYIKKILSRCMLNTRGEMMRACFINIYKIILKFHNRLRSQQWTVGSGGWWSHPNYKSLEQLYQSFCQWRTYMAHVAHKLATSGYQPYLTHFLNALNMNHTYDLTRK